MAINQTRQSTIYSFSPTFSNWWTRNIPRVSRLWDPTSCRKQLDIPAYRIGRSWTAIHSSRWYAAIGCSEVAIKYFSSTPCSSLFSLRRPTTWKIIAWKGKVSFLTIVESDRFLHPPLFNKTVSWCWRLPPLHHYATFTNLKGGKQPTYHLIIIIVYRPFSMLRTGWMFSPQSSSSNSFSPMPTLSWVQETLSLAGHIIPCLPTCTSIPPTINTGAFTRRCPIDAVFTF